MAESTEPSRTMMSWFRTPPNIYFGYNSTNEAVKDLHELKIKRILIITDRAVHGLGYAKRVQDRLTDLGYESEVYADVAQSSSGTIEALQKVMRTYTPEVVIALGGGTVMDMAKIARFTYDPTKPIKKLEELYAYDHMQLLQSSPAQPDRFVKRLICIPTTSGTGSEMTPIAWVYDEASKTSTSSLPLKRPIVSFQMTPEMVVNDAYFVQDLPKEVVVAGGFNVLVAAMESLGSKLASDYTRALSSQAAKLIFHNLQKSMEGTSSAREACHRASSVGGMATANAFVGIAYAIGFVLSNFVEAKRGKKLPQGMSSIMVLPEVIRYNAKGSTATARLYANLVNEAFGHPMEADLPEGSKALDDAVNRLASAVVDLRTKLGGGLSLKDYISKTDFDASIDSIAEDAMKVVGCSSTNAAPVTKEGVITILREAFNS